MQPYEKEPGAPVGGNRLYQEIALVVRTPMYPQFHYTAKSLQFFHNQNSAHTWQSYRDRYLKRLRGRPRPGGMAQPPASSATETGQRGQNQMPASDVALAEPDPSSSRQGSPQRPISTIPSFDRKRKRSDSDGSSTGGDIPPQKRMTTRNPESNQESSTPEVQQGPLPRKIVTLKYGRNNPRTLDIDKGKAPEKAPQNQAWTASQIGPQRIPQRPSQRSPRTSPQQATQTIPQIAFQEYPQKSQRAPENLPQINPSSPQRSSEKAPSKPPQPQESPRGSPQQSSPLALRNAHQNAPQTSPQQILQKSPHKTPQKPPEKPSDPTPKKQQSPPRPFNEVYEPEPIDPMFLELPFLPPSPGASEPEEQPEQDIDAWIDSHLQKGLAKSEDQIIEALRCTSMDPHLADQVLKHLVAGKDIPTDIAGVWTADDDRCIEGRDTRDIERVLEKHGSDYFNSRWQYLDMARTAGLEEVQEGITEL